MSDFIYVTTTTDQDVASNAIVPITTISRKPACSSIGLINNGIVLRKVGYYKISTTAVVTAGAGVTSLQAYKNGTPIPAILTSKTTGDGSLYNLDVAGVIRVYCGEQPAVITLVNTGVATEVNNLSVIVEYIG